MSSAGIVIGALRVKNSRYKLQLVNGKSPFIRRGSLASRLNGYMYSNGKSLNVALFILMANHLLKGNSAITWCKKIFHAELPLL